MGPESAPSLLRRIESPVPKKRHPRVCFRRRPSPLKRSLVKAAPVGTVRYRTSHRCLHRRTHCSWCFRDTAIRSASHPGTSPAVSRKLSHRDHTAARPAPPRPAPPCPLRQPRPPVRPARPAARPRLVSKTWTRMCRAVRGGCFFPLASPAISSATAHRAGVSRRTESLWGHWLHKRRGAQTVHGGCRRGARQQGGGGRGAPHRGSDEGVALRLQTSAVVAVHHS